MKKWWLEYWPRITVGLFLCGLIVFAVLFFLGLPLWEAGRNGIGHLDGQLIYSRTMKEPIEVLRKDLSQEIFIMDLRTGWMRQLTDHRSISTRPDLSSSSPWISYTSFIFHEKEKVRNANLFAYNLITRERRIISYKKGLNLSGSFSTNGQDIYFTIRQGPILDIFSQNLGGNHFRRITKGIAKPPLTGKGRGMNVSNSEPAISPEGGRMAFVSDRDGRPTLYIRDLRTGVDQRILFSGVYNTQPRWSPNGLRLAFQGYLKGHFDVFIIDATGKNLRKITRAKSPSGLVANNENPDFSPDGKEIVFVSDRTGYKQIYAAGVDGSKVRRLTFDTFHYSYPRWVRSVLPTGP